MVENINDLLSILLLLLFPTVIIVYTVFKTLKKRRVNRKEIEGKYYPEW